MYNIRTIPMLHLLGNPQYAIEDPIHLEKSDDDYEEISLDLNNFDHSTYYKNAPKHIKKGNKIINRKFMKKKTILDSK